MDFGGNMFCLGNRDQNGNNNSYGWDSWEITTSTNSKLINAFHTTEAENSTAAVVNGHEAGLANALMFLPQPTNNNHHNAGENHNHHHRDHYQSYPYGGGDGSHSHIHVDPHLMCLKLGKRHYFEDPSGTTHHGGGFGGGGGGGLGLADKRGKGYCGGSGDGGGKAAVPRCQVEGCHVALVNAKDYHRRHKVCEMHSKAPKVVVLGLEQRFCQQCSRFHVVSEFDDSKRSCRRRLAGHNERRRKSSHDSIGRNALEGYAPSLLSSRSRNNSWLSPADLSTRCSAALRELIAENRAAIMARQLSDRDWHLHHHAVEDFKVMIPPPESNCFPQQMFNPTQ